MAIGIFQSNRRLPLPTKAVQGYHFASAELAILVPHVRLHQNEDIFAAGEIAIP
jgi:hypothetical protein